MDLNELLKNLPIHDIAERLGTDDATASQAVGSALPALLQRLQANAGSGGAESLGKALEKHNNDLARSGKIDLAKVDTDDGAKIINHVFGNQPQQVAAQLGQAQPEANSNILSQLLPMLAPIAMSFLANNVAGNKQQGGTDLGGILSSLLGGGQNDKQAGGFDLGGLIGGLFGKRNS